MSDVLCPPNRNVPLPHAAHRQGPGADRLVTWCHLKEPYRRILPVGRSDLCSYCVCQIIVLTLGGQEAKPLSLLEFLAGCRHSTGWVQEVQFLSGTGDVGSALPPNRATIELVVSVTCKCMLVHTRCRARGRTDPGQQHLALL